MISKKEVTKLEKSQVKVTITVDSTEIKKAYDALVQEYSKNMTMKGFRKGKVPISVLEAKYKQELQADAMSRIMDKSLQEALEDGSIAILSYSTPKLDTIPPFSLTESFTFSVTLDVFPEVTTQDYSGIEIEVPTCTVTKEDIDKELEVVRDRNSIVIEKPENKAAEKGDIVTINYHELDEENVAIPNTDRQDFVYTIGTDSNLFNFDDEIIGMKKGDEKTITKTYPADYQYTEIAGKTKKFKLELTLIKIKDLPKLDDDLAQDVSEEYKTLDDLKKAITTDLEKKLEAQLKANRDKIIVASLLEKNQVEVPDSMIAIELEGRFRDLINRFGGNAKQIEDLLLQTGKSKESLMAEWRPDAEKGIKTRIILDKLIETEKIEVSDADIEANFEKMAVDAKTTVEEIRSYYTQNNLAERVKDHLKDEKLFDKIVSLAKIKKGKKISFADLTVQKD